MARVAGVQQKAFRTRLDVLGLTRFEKEVWPSLREDVRQELSRVVRRGGFAMVQAMGPRVTQAGAVRTGELRDSFRLHSTPMTAVVYTDVRHAPFVEFGQSPKGDRLPKPFAFPTFTRLSPQVIKDAEVSGARVLKAAEEKHPPIDV